jgi:hypothetical protein
LNTASDIGVQHEATLRLVLAVAVAQDKVADGINPLIRPLVAVAALNLFTGGQGLRIALLW